MKKGKRICAILLLMMLVGLNIMQTAWAEEEPMNIEAKAAILVDVSSDTPVILYEQNAHDKNYPASITKVMTALLTLEAIERGDLSLEEKVSGSSAITSDLVADGSTQNIQPGEELTVEDLLYCMLVASANEACNILAEAVDGTIEAFVDHMNERAEELGCENTHFVNTHGLPDDNHYTSAYDIYLICKAAMEYPTFQTICNTKQYSIPATDVSPERVFYTTNYLLSAARIPGYYYQYATGIKTGSTGQAGHCLAAAATRNDRSLISVVLGAENVELEDGGLDRKSFSESRRLLQWGFSNFEMKTIIEPTELVKEVPVTLSNETDYLVLRPESTLEALLPIDVDITEFEREITLDSQVVEAPVKEGQVLGKIKLSYEGVEYGTLNLVAVNDVNRSEWLFWVDRITKFFSNPFVKVVLLVLIVVILILIVRRKLGWGRRRKPGYQHYKGRRRKRR